MLASRKRTRVARLTKNSKLFKTIIQAIQEKKGEYIVSLDLRKIHESVADYFIVCQAGLYGPHLPAALPMYVYS